MLLKIAPIQPGMSAEKSCPNLLGPTFATGLHTVINCSESGFQITKVYSSKTTVCRPVAKVAPKKFGQLFFGRHSGLNWSNFEQHFLL